MSLSVKRIKAAVLKTEDNVCGTERTEGILFFIIVFWDPSITAPLHI